MTDITAKLADALREAFNAGRAQGSDEATAYDWGSRASQSADQAFTDMLADWNATDVPAITELRAALTAYLAAVRDKG